MSWEDADTAAITDWIDADAVEDIRPRLLASTALAPMWVSLGRWLADGGQSRLPDPIEACFDLLETGLGQISHP